MKPIAITMGDPCGIGPEITLKACADPRRTVPVVVIGDVDVLARADRIARTHLTVRPITSVDRATFAPGTVDVLTESRLPADLPWGTLDARAGGASFQYVRRGIQLALAAEVRALVTAPINKEALRLSGVPYPGHTEILADLSGTTDYAMMMATDELRIVLVTVHQSLRTAIDAITTDRELDIIRLTHRTLRRGGLPAPASPSPASTPTPGRTACSAARTWTSSPPPYEPRRAKASRPADPGPPTPSSCGPAPEPSTPWSPSTTTRASSPSSTSGSNTASTSPSACPSSVPASTTAPRSTSPVSAPPTTPACSPPCTTPTACPQGHRTDSDHQLTPGTESRRTPWTSSSCSPATTGPSPTASTSSTPSRTSASPTSDSRTSASTATPSPNSTPA